MLILAIAYIAGIITFVIFSSPYELDHDFTDLKILSWPVYYPCYFLGYLISKIRKVPQYIQEKRKRQKIKNIIRNR